jgi:hypothetical protein
MPTVKTTITATKCSKWVYGPQVSPENSNYAVGGAGKWIDAMTQCDKDILSSGIVPTNLIDNLDKPVDVINKIVIDYLDNSPTILPILLMHSAFINALGMLQYGKRTGYEQLKNLLNAAYLTFYQKTQSLLKNKDHISIFVHPDTFLKLVLPNTPRPRNIVMFKDSKTVLDDLVKLYTITTDSSYDPNHPIPFTYRQCKLGSTDTCSKPFANIKNSAFAPVSDLIVCYCSYLTQDIKIETTYQQITYNKIARIGEFTRYDYEAFNKVFFWGNKVFDAMIIAKKPKTFLSQLLQYTCIHLYKPPIIAPKTNTVDDIIYAAKQNIKVSRVYLFNYSPLFFTTCFITGPGGVSTLPIYFIEKDAEGREGINFNSPLSSTREFLENVVNDFKELGVFKPMLSGDNARYELNTEFDIELLECFRLLPNNEIKNSIKNELIPHFYSFVANVIILAITNGIFLPFKLSIFYIIRVFDLVNLQSIATTIDEKILLCSIYLTEKASTTFKNNVISMMETPDFAKSIWMNNTLRILEEDRPVYDEDTNVFIQNVIDYIYMNAYKHYMEVIPTDIPISSDAFKPNNNLQAFLFGLKYIKDFNSTTVATPIPHNPLKTANYTFDLLLGIIRKVTLRMDGVKL